MSEGEIDQKGLSYRLCSEIAEPLGKLKKKISDKHLVERLETEIRSLVFSVYELKNPERREAWIKSIRDDLESFLKEKKEDIADKVLSEVRRHKEMVENALKGIDDTQYCVYQ